jgi:glycosyltransferase involved in cell wall biosynthesis
MTPTVSIIVPCYNEQATIRGLLDAVLAQTYPLEKMDVVISDGMSTDGTREAIAAFQREHPELPVQVVDNTAKSIPASVNRAIEAAGGEILLRLDAHSMPHPEYVARCVAALEEGRGDNVGGVWEIRPGAPTWAAESIAAAAAHPLGVGDAMYRLAPSAGPVDTVPFGAFRRSLVERIGKYDETLLSNEDYEFNARVRQSGGTVWLDPAIRSVYFSRSTFGALARQYWRYGFWKLRMLRRYPSTLRWRQALPPVFVLSLAGLFLLGLWLYPFRGLLGLEILFYLSVMLLAGLRAAHIRRKPLLAIGLPLAIATMHIAWGSGFLWSLLTSLVRKNG